MFPTQTTRQDVLQKSIFWSQCHWIALPWLVHGPNRLSPAVKYEAGENITLSLPTSSCSTNVSNLVLVRFLSLQNSDFSEAPALRRHMFISWSKLSSETRLYIFSCMTVNTLERPGTNDGTEIDNLLVMSQHENDSRCLTTLLVKSLLGHISDMVQNGKAAVD